MGKESVTVAAPTPDLKPETWGDWFCRHGTMLF